MRTIELPYTDHDPEPKLSWLSNGESLRLSDRMSLATCKGSSHWHISRPGQKGTLELTWWPGAQRLWLKVASNREGDWIDGVIDKLTGALACEA